MHCSIERDQENKMFTSHYFELLSSQWLYEYTFDFFVKLLQKSLNGKVHWRVLKGHEKLKGLKTLTFLLKFIKLNKLGMF